MYKRQAQGYGAADRVAAEGGSAGGLLMGAIANLRPDLYLSLIHILEKYHVAWVRHDYPLPQHNWSFQAAVNARWFDTKSKKLGDDYRNAVFANQASIESKDDLQKFTQRFAQQHGAALPFVMDPQGKPVSYTHLERRG